MPGPRAGVPPIAVTLQQTMINADCAVDMSWHGKSQVNYAVDFGGLKVAHNMSCIPRGDDHHYLESLEGGSADVCCVMLLSLLSSSLSAKSCKTPQLLVDS